MEKLYKYEQFNENSNNEFTKLSEFAATVSKNLVSYVSVYDGFPEQKADNTLDDSNLILKAWYTTIDKKRNPKNISNVYIVITVMCIINKKLIQRLLICENFNLDLFNAVLVGQIDVIPERYYAMENVPSKKIDMKQYVKATYSDLGDKYYIEKFSSKQKSLFNKIQKNYNEFIKIYAEELENIYDNENIDTFDERPTNVNNNKLYLQYKTLSKALELKGFENFTLNDLKNIKVQAGDFILSPEDDPQDTCYYTLNGKNLIAIQMGKITSDIDDLTIKSFIKLYDGENKYAIALIRKK